jgi:quinoprotein dehydrogenase-associated probable ABC transporter substrate-binding protein
MSSRCPRLVAAALLAAALASQARAETLTICGDPNNLPFSNERLEGFENRIARILAEDLGMDLDWYWWAQRRGYVRNTLGAGACSLVMGVPAGFERTLNTRPYYRSTYVFVSRRDRDLAIRSFDDPALGRLKVGVQMIGDDFSNTPPAHAMARRQLIGNVTGFMVYGDYGAAIPQSPILDAVASGAVDLAVVWGPLAGYLATREPVPLAVTPVGPESDGGLRMSFAIALGVRRGDQALRDRLQGALDRHEPEIEAVLREYGVPLLPVRR